MAAALSGKGIISPGDHAGVDQTFTAKNISGFSVTLFDFGECWKFQKVTEISLYSFAQTRKLQQAPVTSHRKVNASIGPC